MEEKKEKNKLMSFISYWWEKEAIRFIFIGGINTVVGILFTMLLRFIFNKVQWIPRKQKLLLEHLGVSNVYYVIHSVLFPI